MLVAQSDQRLTALGRQHGVGRVLKGRDGVDHLDPLALGLHGGDLLGETLGHESVLVDLGVAQVGLVRREDCESARVRRALGDDDIARVEHHLGQHLEGELAAGGHDDVVRVRLDALQTHHLDDEFTKAGEAHHEESGDTEQVAHGRDDDSLPGIAHEVEERHLSTSWASTIFSNSGLSLSPTRIQRPTPMRTIESR